MSHRTDVRQAAQHDIASQEYADRVYAGVLGKMIGVYLGCPIEGMPYREILKQFGPIQYFVHEARGHELVVVDDDISGTFTFPRALEDHPRAGRALTPQHVAQTWLNYVIEGKTIFWWGGLGLSTEHTAYLRLKDGIPAPQSGTIEMNSRVVAEQIGSQIFIDGWAMIAPGDPRLAADLARTAASVSHDGEAIYGAQVIAAMEAMAFVEPDMDALLDVGLAVIPADSLTARMIRDLRAFHAAHPDDWKRAFVEVMERSYGYDKFGGNCHIIPNHGVVILALLYGRDDFQRALMIANTCGWDTDCNAGNVGCLMGIRLGLAGIDAGPDWRGPIADRMMISTADGGETMTDAVREAYRLVNIGRSLRSLPPLAPKDGARFHFSLPGSVQGFREDPRVDSRGTTSVGNDGGRLSIAFHGLAPGRVARVSTPTFAPPGSHGGAYGVLASPTLSPGQSVTASVTGDAAVDVRLYAKHYAERDAVAYVFGPTTSIRAGEPAALRWTVPPTDGQPIFEVGIEVRGVAGVSGTLLLDRMAWGGAPDVTLGGANVPGEMARRQWGEGVDGFRLVSDPTLLGAAFFAVHNKGRGLAIHGTRDWHDYEVRATLTPHLAIACGLAARVRGLRRYYALLLKHPNKVALVKAYDGERTLADLDFVWRWNDDPHDLALRVVGNRITGSVDGKTLFDVVDDVDPLESGGIALVIEEGRLISGPVSVQPAARS